MPHHTTPARSLLTGALGGIAGTFMMDRYQQLLARTTHLPRKNELASNQGEQRSKLEQDEPATVKAAALLIQRTTGRRASRTQRRAGGTLLHYAYGACAGAAYGLLADHARRPSVPKGIAWGLLVWIVADETVTPLLGIAPKPWQSRPTSHAVAATAHVVFGGTTEIARRALHA